MSELPINQIICGDCLEVMKDWPENCVDLVFTSPPYNLIKERSAEYCNKETSNRKGQYDNWYFDEMPEYEYQLWQINCLKEMTRICNGSVFYNHKIRFAWARRNTYYHPMQWLNGFDLWAEIIWDRCGAIPSKCPIFNMQDERIYQIGRPSIWNNMQYTTIWKVPPCSDGSHPCSFPEELPKRSIEIASSPNSLVFDPFCGSGTTCVAAKKLGRNYIGIDISEEYCQIARDRLESVDTGVPVKEARKGQMPLF